MDVYPCPPADDLRQYEGFSYLAEALADRGYVALVPDISAEFNNGFGEPQFGERSLQIIDAHLGLLAAGEGFAGDVAGKADFDRLFVVAHSRGGPLAVRYLANVSQVARPARALFLLAPAAMPVDETLPGTLPAALLIAGCDGDVSTQQPLLFREAQLPDLRPALTMTYTLPTATHNAFSSRLEQDRAASCQDVELLNPQAQREITMALIPAFFDLVLAMSGVFSS